MSKVIKHGDIFIVADKISMFTKTYDTKSNTTDFSIYLVGDDEPMPITVDGVEERDFAEKLIKAIEG